MIVVDAAVLIALVDGTDAHHVAAVGLFAEHIDETFTIGPINQAEALVRAARDGGDDEMLADFRALGIIVTPLPDDAGPRLARLRARAGVKMPDCCILLTADQTSAKIATFDTRLASAAESLGFPCVVASVS